MRLDDNADIPAYYAPEEPVSRLSFPPPPTIPHYTLIRRIGSGGYGEVWLAHNTMGEWNAIKIVYRSCFNEAKPFERELNGIRRYSPISKSLNGFIGVRKVSVDEEAGYFYYIMELADDVRTGAIILDAAIYVPKTLTSEIQERGRLPASECIRLGMTLATALHEMHRRGLVHRDVKPSNIVYVGGVPKFADIGMVTSLFEPLSRVGTEGFSPPEGPGTPEADLFSLGKVLYEACSGRDRKVFPHMPESAFSASEEEALRELNFVIARACETDPAARYKSAEEMCSDLLILLDGRSIERLRHLERRLRQVRRTGVALAIGLAVLVAVAYPINQLREGRAQVRQREIGLSMGYGNRSLLSGDLVGSLPYFADALRLRHEAGEDETTDRLRLGMILAQCPKLVQVLNAPPDINDGEFSPDGRHIIVAFDPGDARIYDLKNPSAPPVTISHPTWITSAVFSHDGGRILTSCDDGTAYVRDAKTLAVVKKISLGDRIKSARFSKDDSLIITACRDGYARIHGAEGTVPLAFYHGKSLHVAALSHDGKTLATAGDDRILKIWDVTTGTSLPPLFHNGRIYGVEFSPDDTEIVTACADNKARVFKVSDGSQRFPALTHLDGVYSAEYSPDGRYLLTAGLDGTAALWRRDTLQPLEVNPVFRMGERVTHAAFAPDSRRILLTGSLGLIEIWDLSGTGTPPVEEAGVLSPDGKRLLSVTRTNAVIEDAATEEPLGPAFEVSQPISKITLNKDGQFALESLPEGKVRIVATSTGQEIRNIVFPDVVHAFSVSDDGLRVAGFGSNLVKVVDMRNGVELFSKRFAQNVGGCVFLSKAPLLVAWDGKSVELLSASDGSEQIPPVRFDEEVRHVALRSDERQLVACCWDLQWTACYAQVWDLATGKTVGPKLPQSDGVLWCCFSPDGKRIGTAGEDFTAAIWDSGGAQLAPALRHADHVNSIAFSPVGNWTITGSRDHTARIWNTETGDPISPSLRQLTPIKNAAFLSPMRVVTQGTNGLERFWTLVSESRPLPDILDHAGLLAGMASTQPVGSNNSRPESIEIVWRRLHSRYPSMFESSADEIVKWHEFVVEESQINRDMQASQFHQAQLQNLRLRTSPDRDRHRTK